MVNNTTKSILYGVLASAVLIGVYFVIVSLISEPNFAISQWNQYWYFIVSLAVGFGIQMGLYTYLKNEVRNMQGNGRVLGITGTTSTATMISCCTHYLVNVLPVLGVTGIATFVSQYQTDFFWIGILFNLAGIFYLANRIVKFKKYHE